MDHWGKHRDFVACDACVRWQLQWSEGQTAAPIPVNAAAGTTDFALSCAGPCCCIALDVGTGPAGQMAIESLLYQIHMGIACRIDLDTDRVELSTIPVDNSVQ